MERTDDKRGVLFPSRLPSFHRLQPSSDLEQLIRWIWIPRWDLAPGHVEHQLLLPFPASNLVIEAGRLELFGPASSASHRELRGSGWAVGVLLRPAALAALHPCPSRLRDAQTCVEAPALTHAVGQAMNQADPQAGRESAAQLVQDWAQATLGQVDEQGLLANRMEDLIAGDRELVRVEQLAQRLTMSARGVQRLAQRYVGLTPLAMIRRYRLQEGAKRLRLEPGLGLARLAGEPGYSDQAHFSRDFRVALGMTPTDYARAV